MTTKRKSQSLLPLLEEVERRMLAGPISPDEQRHCVQTMSTVLQTVAQAIARPLPGSDMQEIRGNNHVKRALEVAAAGGHHVLLSGPHQAGKAQLARTLPSILPAAAVPYPFRAPDSSSIGRAAFIGDPTAPGELAFAHEGVLFLKNLHRFDLFLLDAVRQAVETHVVAFPKGEEHIRFPANFLLVATTMPCPCGFYGDAVRECRCSVETVGQHQQRMKTIIDTCFDVQVEVPAVREDLLSRCPEESSAQIRGRVEQARTRQRRRYATTPFQANADLRSVEEIQRYCPLNPQAQVLLRSALQQLHPSPLGLLRMQKVARTIADLAGSEQIMAQHLAEAIQYRSRI